MTFSERTLEEDEAKIDNILHKIVKSMEHARSLIGLVRESTKDKVVIDNLRLIDILAETVLNLAWIADDIDIKDEAITTELESNVKTELQKAIANINKAADFLEPEKIK